MVTVSLEQAKDGCEQLIARVEEGEVVVIEREGRAVAKLIRHEGPPKREFGSLKGRIKVDDRFFAPLPEEELRAWEGS